MAKLSRTNRTMVTTGSDESARSVCEWCESGLTKALAVMVGALTPPLGIRRGATPSAIRGLRHQDTRRNSVVCPL
ncbi:hypothetical protein GCM10027436_17840 [Actinophytocola sediminis]